jgi:hypothetical protein
MPVSFKRVYMEAGWLNPSRSAAAAAARERGDD